MSHSGDRDLELPPVSYVRRTPVGKPTRAKPELPDSTDPERLAPAIRAKLQPIADRFRLIVVRGANGRMAALGGPSLVKKPKKSPSPFEGDEAKEAFRQALRSAFAANQALIDFIEEVLRSEPVEPLDAIEKAAASARDAEAAWACFLRLSRKSYSDNVSLNQSASVGMRRCASLEFSTYGLAISRKSGFHQETLVAGSGTALPGMNVLARFGAKAMLLCVSQ